MASGPLPIKFREVISLSAMGIPADSIKFKDVTVESPRFITVRSPDAISMIDTESRTTSKLNVQVESAIMNPTALVVGLQAPGGKSLQIYNLEMKSRMKQATMPEKVQFWKWLNSNMIAIVTPSSVYHWSMDSDKEPVKMFDRVEDPRPVQIINYRASNDLQWLILGGITKGPENTIDGILQLYSVERKASQPPMNAHAGCFAHIQLPNRPKKATLFCFTSKAQGGGNKLSIVELGSPVKPPLKVLCDLRFAQPKDFAVSMIPDEKHGMLFILTKAGFLYLYDILSGKCLFAKRVATKTMFASVATPDGGVFTVDANGRAILFELDEKNLVPFLQQKDLKFASTMAQRLNLPGAEGVFKKQFEQLVRTGQYQQAAELAVKAPQEVLRTPETVERLKQVPVQHGQKSPVLLYFSLLLKTAKLNAFESIELCKPVLQRDPQKGKEHIKDWIKEEKLDFSADLGDLLRKYDLTLACSVYLRASVPSKAIGCFLQLGQYQKIIDYANDAGFSPDYAHLLSQLHRQDRKGAKSFAAMLVQRGLLKIEEIIDIFMRASDVETTTSFLLEVLKQRGDRPEDAELQTKLLEINLLGAPQIAEALLEGVDDTKFTHYDRLHVAQLCERAQLYQRALEHFEDLTDIKRVLQMGLAAGMIQPEFLLRFFGELVPEDGLECLRDLLKYNMQQNIRLVVEVAKRYSEQLTPAALITLFEEFQSWSGLFYYLGSFVNFSEDTEVVFKYIQAAVELDQMREVERVCRDNEHFDSDQVKGYLLEKNLKDPRPLIYVCDRAGFQEELTTYLYQNQKYPFIEAYVKKMNPAAAPKVVGALLDLNAPEDSIRDLINSVRPPQCPVAELVEEVEKRTRLRILLSWLEARMHEGLQDTALHNALAKVYVEINNNPRQFLVTNKFYDHAEVGKYCESRNPQLAFIAYREADGACDHALVEVTNKHGFFKDQAQYLVSRQDEELWAFVLDEKNDHRQELIDQVVATALPGSRVPEEVSTTVKAFMKKSDELSKELIELLERIVLHGDADRSFHNNRNLQNLLILTAIKADKKRVMDYLGRLDNYDGPDIAKIAISEQYKLYEEAYFIYRKFDKGDLAINVLLNNLESIERATEFAEYSDNPAVWLILGRAQLDEMMVKEAIGSFLKADDAQYYEDVIRAAAQEGEHYDSLIKFLLMARTKIRDATIDTELIYAYAKTEKLADLEDFINASHQAQLEAVGDRCYNQDLPKAAKILYSHISNYAKLALCLVRLEQYNNAVEAARRANTINTWRAVCFSCVDAEEFRLAQICGLQIVVQMDHLQSLIQHYKQGGHFDQIIALLEQGTNLDRAHQGIYTQLGILYCEHKEDALAVHIDIYWQRVNIPTLLQACKSNLRWAEAVTLYCRYDQFDNAIDTIIEHSSECFNPQKFNEIISHVTSNEVFYRAINFYLREHPDLVSQLLIDLSAKLDHKRVVETVRLTAPLPLLKSYLQHVQRENIPQVNEALNTLYVEEEDHQALRESIDLFDKFDQIQLAQQLERHELVDFRRLAAYLYKKNERWEHSIDMSKADRIYQDAMDTAAQSGKKDLAEGLLKFFVDNEEKECFAACLYTCFELLEPDVVLELAWRNGLTQYAMPFMIQSFKEVQHRLTTVEEKLKRKELEQQEIDANQRRQQEAAVKDAAQLIGGGLAPQLALTGPGYGAPQGPPGGYGQPQPNPYGAPQPAPGPFGGGW